MIEDVVPANVSDNEPFVSKNVLTFVNILFYPHSFFLIEENQEFSCESMRRSRTV